MTPMNKQRYSHSFKCGQFCLINDVARRIIQLNLWAVRYT